MDINSEFDELARLVPDSVLDTRFHYWSNFSHPLYIHHRPKRLVYSIRLPTPISESGSYYVASFGESLLLTWVGLETRVHRRFGASTNITLKVVRGNESFTSEHKDVAGYCKVSPPVCRQEPREIHLRTTEDEVDIGFMVHERVHKDYSFELVTRF